MKNIVFVELQGVRYSPDHPFPRPPVFDFRPMLKDEIDCAIRHGCKFDTAVGGDELAGWLEDDGIAFQTTAECLAQ